MNIKIEHVALWVNDLEAMKNFYIKYFNAKSSPIYKSKTKDFQSYFISFNYGTRIELMKMPGSEGINKQPNIGYSHIAFSVGNKNNVDKLTNRLVKDGFTIQSYPRLTGDGYYESVIIDIEGNILEITE